MMSAYSRSILWAVLSGIAIVGLLLASQLMKKEPVDALGCSATIGNKTVLVVDTSDEVTAQTKAEMQKRVRALVDNVVQEGDLVSIFWVSELSKRNLVPSFAFCKPRRTGNALNENTRSLARIYQEKFLRPLEAALLAPIKGSTQSPIAQAIVDISLSDYLRTTGTARLVVFSDFMEFTDKFSMYKCKAGAQSVSEFKASRGASVARPSFHNVDIQMDIIPRTDIEEGTGKCRNYFWSWFFGDNEGPLSQFTPSNLPG